jgi:hypothetical protein
MGIGVFDGDPTDLANRVWVCSCYEIEMAQRIAAALNAQEERLPPTMTPEEAREFQRWKGMDGAIAYQLIERHADGWADVGVMMNAWLEANALNQQAGVVEALEDCIDSLEYVNRTHPDASGWGVRSERIAKARAALAAAKGVDRDH